MTEEMNSNENGKRRLKKNITTADNKFSQKQYGITVIKSYYFLYI